MAFKYGRLAPHPEETHPRVKLSAHLTPNAVPAVVDWASRVQNWPMYGNDTIGDCTCAAIGHALEAWTTYADGTTLAVPETDVLSLYEAVSGYNPVTGANDNGAVEQDVLAYVQKNGIGGHKILAYAQVDVQDPQEMKQALDVFGSVYLGIEVPETAQEQFANGEPWDYVPGAQIEGGHAINLQKWDTQFMYPVTWGKLQPMTSSFWQNYGTEAWVIVTEDWISAKGLTPTGLNLASLLAEFHSVTGATYSVPEHSWLTDLVDFFERVF